MMLNVVQTDVVASLSVQQNSPHNLTKNHGVRTMC